jgi:hypothetical protein
MGLPAYQAHCCVFVGLTDHPGDRCEEQGSPPDWQLYGPFHSEAAAQRWERMMETLPGYAVAGPCTGWRFGYTHSAHAQRPALRLEAEARG